MNVNEIKKAIEDERAKIMRRILERREEVKELHALNKADRAAFDALPRLAVKRPRKAKVTT